MLLYVIQLPYYHEGINRLKITMLQLTSIYSFFSALTYIPAISSSF